MTIRFLLAPPLLVGLLQACGNGKVAQNQQSQFVDPQTCLSCHPQQYAEWAGSHHDLAMQAADTNTVLGDFNDATFRYYDVTSRFFKKNGKFFVNAEGADGSMADFEIKYTFGVEPLQQYLIEFPGGRLQSLTIAWNTQKQRWFHLYPNERIRPGDPLHWTGIYQNWNLMCADCHSTGLRKNYDARSDRYRTTWEVINVSCQACHGPGKQHVEWARAREAGRDSGYFANAGLTVDLKADARQQVETCAPCHSRRHRISNVNDSGQPLLDTFVPALLRQGLYYADGQILDEVYEYGSFLQSKMYHRGVACSDCHHPHSLKLRHEGNALCVQCHQPTVHEKFKTLQLKVYDSPSHHHHQPGSEGAQCVNCHMPTRTYMVVDPRRDHSFRIPRPDLSVKLGTPNACNLCHQDRSPQWAAGWVQQWYGPARQNEFHYAEAIAAGRAQRSEAAAQLVALAGDTTQAVIVRATALELLHQYSGEEVIAALVAAAAEKEPLLRVAAVGGLERLPAARRLATVGPLLEDPVRAVRIEAARVLASVPPKLFSLNQQRAFDAALAEFRQAQAGLSDQPSAYLNLGVLHENKGRADSAESAYRMAIKLDPYFAPALFNLANLYNRHGQNREAEQVLRSGIERMPENGQLYYSLGLLLAEEQRLEEACIQLGKAAELLPHYVRARYNYALALQHLGRRREAEAALLQTHAIDPRDPDTVHALAIFFMQEQKWDQALTYAEKLVELAPEAPEPRQMLLHIRRQRSKQ